ncbi:MAG TPA: hypothetical protein VD963_02475 [Phycisphaerales bacterium]|nr:hypothetical protein [Phycisphaerales bacterium]
MSAAKGAAPRGGRPTGPPVGPGGEDPEVFYADVLRFLAGLEVPFMVGGTYAVNAYIGSHRPTKDMDVFVRAGDYPRIINAAADANFETLVEDERWIAKVLRGPFYCDVIFASANMISPVTDEWFRESSRAEVLGVTVNLLPPTELVWSKSFIADRYKFDGNDVAHVMLVKHDAIDWERLLRHMDQHWEVLLMHIIRFRYIYPSERERIPRWLLDLLLGRLNDHMNLPTPQKKACRGRIFSREDFQIDVAEWGFADLGGDDKFS